MVHLSHGLSAFVLVVTLHYTLDSLPLSVAIVQLVALLSQDLGLGQSITHLWGAGGE